MSDAARSHWGATVLTAPGPTPLGAVLRQWRVLALIAAVATLFALFRLSLTFVALPAASTSFQVHAVRTAADVLQLFLCGVLLWALIQPVRALGPKQGLRRWLTLAVTVAIASVLTSLAWSAWLVFGTGQQMDRVWPSLHVMVVRYALLSGLLVVVGEFHRHEMRSLEAMRAAELDRGALEQQTLQARLRTLEAQIEPHFLFNTLATVRRLYETDVDAGEAMLDRLMRYLEVALPTMRGSRSTLAREGELVGAYLDLQRIRMGHRLRFRLDIPPPLAGAELPSMMLLTLVENAIKHGLAPQRDGGRVDVSARSEQDMLVLDVADDGRGFGGDTSGGGTGLANIRARLQAEFGSGANFVLEPREPQGILATIRLPMRWAEAA